MVIEHSKQELQHLLDEFARYMGLDDFSLDQNNEALLYFDETLPLLLHFDPTHKLLTFDATLGPAQDKTTFSAIALSAAGQWRELNLWFSVSQDSDAFHVYRVIPFSTFQQLLPELEAFIKAASHWQQLAKSASSDSDAEADHGMPV